MRMSIRRVVATTILAAALTSASPEVDPPFPPKVPYARNSDYSKPANAETMLWISCMLDHGKWPKRKEVAISSTGLVLVVVWQTQTSGRLTPLRLEPWQVRQYFHIAEHQVELREIRSRRAYKNEPYTLTCEAEYARPHRSHAGIYVHSIDSEVVQPWIDILQSLLARANKASETEPDDAQSRKARARLMLSLRLRALAPLR